ncbi:hypothetical protein, partial [Bacteroides caccae]
KEILKISQLKENEPIFIVNEKKEGASCITTHLLSISSRHLPFHRGNYDRHYGRHNKGNALRVNKRDASGKLLGRHPFS